ncbi:MAG: hypothetical protein JW883_12615, partial [Deltaproteobacteria bacterium]|nr:hypothetical protein [Deltaproteobacteria bacterium]
MKTKTIAKFICLILVLSLVTFLVILRSTKEAKRESMKTEKIEKVRKGALPEPPITQDPVQEELLPQKEPFEEPDEAETDIIETVQGRVTGTEYICTDMILIVDGIHLEEGSVNLSRIHIGDLVEATYIKKKAAKIIKSIEVLEPARNKLPPQKEPLQELEESLEWEVPTQKAPLEEPDEADMEIQTEEEPLEEPDEADMEIQKTMQGRVTGTEYICTD